MTSKGFQKGNKINLGCTPWNKGTKVDREKYPTMGSFGKRTEEQKKKISLGHKGINTWSKGKIFPEKTGENNPAWKGGVTSLNKLERKRFRNTILKSVLERDNYTCQLCGIRGVVLQVDHIQPWAEYIELRFNMDNCRTLCKSCHYKITFGREMPSNIKTWGENMKTFNDRRILL